MIFIFLKFQNHRIFFVIDMIDSILFIYLHRVKKIDKS